MINKALTLFLLLHLSVLVVAQSTVVYGQNASYAHKKLELLTSTHHLFRSPLLLDSTIVNEMGQFSFRFNLNEPKTVFLNLGYYSIQFIALPGDSINIALAPYRPLSKSELYNPYFVPEKFHIIPNSGKSLHINAQLIRFESTFDSLYNLAINALVLEKSDSLGRALFSSQFHRSYGDSFLEQHIKYTSLSLYELVNPFAVDSLIGFYFSRYEPEFENDAFWNVFNKAFENPLIIPGKNQLVPDFEVAVWRSNYVQLISRIMAYYQIENRNMAQLVALRGIFRSWNDFNDLHLMFANLLDSAIIENENARITEIARDIKHKLTTLEYGKKAPYYELPGINNKRVPTSLKGKYLILAFGSPELAQCQRDYLLLEELLKAHNNYMEVVAVVVYQHYNEFLKFAEVYKGNINFAHWNSNMALLNDYNIKGLPVYYIIDAQQNLRVSSALTRPEEIEAILKDLGLGQ